VFLVFLFVCCLQCVWCVLAVEFGGRRAMRRRRRAILLCKCTLFFAARQLSTRHSPTPTSFLFRSVGVGAAGVNRVTTANQITPTTSTQTATTKRRSPKSFRRTTTLSSAWIASHLTRFVVVFSCKHCGPSTLRGASTDECGNCYIQAMQWDLSDSRTELMTQSGEYQHAECVAAGAAEKKAEHYLRIGQRKLEENKRRQVVTSSNQQNRPLQQSMASCSRAIRRRGRRQTSRSTFRRSRTMKHCVLVTTCG